MFSNAALTCLMGFTTVIIVFLMVNYHNTWVKDWTVLITIMGWRALIKGVLMIAFPKFIQRFSERICKGRVLKTFPYVAISLGLLFGYFGFVH